MDLLEGGAATLHRNRVGMRCSAEGLHLTPTVATRAFGGSVSIGLGIAASVAAFLSSYINSILPTNFEDKVSIN